MWLIVSVLDIIILEYVYVCYILLNIYILELYILEIYILEIYILLATIFPPKNNWCYIDAYIVEMRQLITDQKICNNLA